MPSLYETTAPTGEVSSSNFTTLYNASGLAVPNAGAGSVTGNLNVSGNLTVQGTSQLIGAVVIGSTLSTPNYTFPLPDGTTDQVLVTDGSGNLYWTDVSAIPGAAYSISATTATGGANLTLADSAGGTDSVKFAGGTNVTVTRTDANTITISSSADDIPDGTANGQVLVWESGAWTANNVVTASSAITRLVAELKDNTTTTAASLAYRRNTGSTPYVSGTTATLLAQIDSDSQALASFGSSGFAYDATDPIYAISTSVDNFATRTFLQVMDSTTIGFNGNNLVLNRAVTGAPSSNASFTVERGTSTDATITWDETDDRWELNYDLIAPGLQGGNIQVGINSDNNIYIGGNDLNLDTDGSHVVQSNSPIQTTAQSMSINSDNTAADSQLNFKSTTQYIKWNNTTQQFELSNAAVIGGNLTVNGNYSQTGESMTINSDSTAADSYLYMKGSSEYLKWNNTDSQFELSDTLFITLDDYAAIFERQKTTADSNQEGKAPLKLIQRVTDAPNNQTDDGGANIIFSRTSGASGGTETLYSTFQSDYFGTTNKADFKFIWSTDDFTETNPTSGIYPATYSLLSIGSDQSKFFNDSLTVNYNVTESTDTATSITGGNTLVFPTAHGYTAGQRLQFQSTSQNGLIQSAFYYVLATGLTTTQCRVSLQSGGTAATLTNGTGLTLVFANVINQIGINTSSPAYTLDVNGDARVTGNITTGGITAGNITVGVVDDNTISTTTGALAITAATGQLVEITSDLTSGAVGPTRITRNTSSTTGQIRALSLRTNSTGTPAVGLATQLDFEVETAAGTFTRGGYVEVESTSLSPNNFKMNFGVATSGTEATVASLDNTGTLTLDNDLAVNGGDITTTQTTASVFNTTATTVNAFGAATNITIGVDGAVAGAGTTTIRSASTVVKGDLAVNGDNTGSVADITTTKTSATIFNTNATTVKLGEAATTVSIGATTGTTTVNNDLAVKGDSITINSGAATGADAYIYVDRGSSGTDASIKWEEANTFWRVSNSLYADDGVIGGNYIATNGNNIYFNNEDTSPSGTCNLQVKSGVSSGVNANFRWNDTTNRWQDTTDGSTYYDLPNQNLDTTSDVSFSSITLDSRSTFNTGTTTTTSTSAFTLDETNRNAIKLMVYIEQGTESHALEILIMRTSASAMMTTYGEMYTTSPLATFTADQSAGNIRVRCTPTSATSTTFSVVRYSLT